MSFEAHIEVWDPKMDQKSMILRSKHVFLSVLGPFLRVWGLFFVLALIKGYEKSHMLRKKHVFFIF